MGRTLSWIANGVLFVLCCFLVAETVNDVFAALLTPSPDEVTVAAPSAVVAPAGRAWSDREVILSRNLFNASLLAPQTPEVVEEEVEELEETQLPLRLLGTAAAVPTDLSWAAVQDESDRKTLVVGLSDSVRGAVVERIERRRIVLREKGGLRELLLDEDDGAGPNAAIAARSAVASRRRPPARTNRTPRAARPAPEPIRQIAEDKFEVERGQVDDILRNPASLFSQARILPKYEEGEMVGLQINAVKPGSLFEDVGISSGDVVTSVNGQEINDPEQSGGILEQLSGSDPIILDVEHADGTTSTVEIVSEESE